MKAVGEVKGIIDRGTLQKTSGKVMFSFQKDSVGDTIHYGDLVEVHTSLTYVKPPMNPDEFNYKHYLEMNGIYSEAFVPKHSFHLTGRSDAPWPLCFTDKCRHKLIDLLNHNIKGNAAAVASAILLGYRNDLSPSVVEEFVDSGTVHVICVAGLHVGIIIWLLNFLLLFLDNYKHGKLIRTLLLLSLVWLYALFTGMATPVIRASTMFSFLLVGRHFSRYTNSVNTLASSAFLVLLFNPFQLVDTGFQLSYLSVLGILTIYPLLNNIFEPGNFILKKIWELTCLSASAQLSIAPLSFLYFHQFPNYFLITNLLVVPLLSIVIYVGVLFFLTSYIPYISVAITWLFQKSLLLMNTLVGQSNHLPFYVTRGISISYWETTLLFISIICLFVFFSYKTYRPLVLGLLSLLLFIGTNIYKNILHSKQQLFAIYHVYKHTVPAFISGKESVMPFSDVSPSDFGYHVQYHFWEKGVKDTLTLRNDTSAVLLSGHMAVQYNFIQFNGKRYVFLRSNDDLPDSLDKFPVHCVIVSADYKAGMEALQNAFTFDTLIFDSSIAPSRLKKWKEQCAQLHISYYDVSKQGAYIENS